jgi:hypothetical protein
MVVVEATHVFLMLIDAFNRIDAQPGTKVIVVNNKAYKEIAGSKPNETLEASTSTMLEITGADYPSAPVCVFETVSYCSNGKPIVILTGLLGGVRST